MHGWTWQKARHTHAKFFSGWNGPKGPRFDGRSPLERHDGELVEVFRRDRCWSAVITSCTYVMMMCSRLAP